MNSTSVADIKTYWQERAVNDVPEDAVTHPDFWLRWLEIELIKKYVKGSQRVLDVGCGNGYTTRQIADLVDWVIGIDNSPEMIKRAKEETVDFENIDYAVDDIMAYKAVNKSFFDTVISERCLINLTSFEDQKKAIDNITSVLKPGGFFIFCEVSSNARQRVNDLRKDMGLNEMPDIWHNLNFDENQVVEYLKKDYLLKDRKSTGIYDFFSRIVHPLLVAPEEPKYDSKINQIAAQIALARSSMDEFSRALFLILRKK